LRILRSVGLPTLRPADSIAGADLGVDLPVYPDGPVTLTLPVTASGHTVEAVIGYAACSATQCLLPVAGRTVALTEPAGD
jgi:hypothetical protein